MSTTRTIERFRSFILSALGDYHSHEDAFHISVARQHLLADSMGTARETRNCEAYSATLVNRAVGCWEAEAYKAVKPAWLAGTVPTSKTEHIYFWPQRIAIEFGEQVSLKKEQDIAALIRRIILLDNTAIRTELDAFAETLNDTTITWNSGNGTITIVNGDGSMELPRQLFAGNTLTFDAPARLVINRIFPADSTGPLFTLGVPPDYKGVIDATRGEERETITNNARDSHIITIEKYDEFDAKITGGANIEADIRLG